MIPPIVVAISILIYYAILIPYATSALFGVRISLFDTYIGLILIYTVTTLPFVIWMMLTFIDEVPYTLEHAARLMGAGRMTVIRRIVLPLVASGMVVTFLFVFILNWAEFLLALTLDASRGDDADGAAQQVPERVGGPPLRPAGRDRHDDHDPGGDPRHPDPEAPGQGLQLRHHPQVVARIGRHRERIGNTVARIAIKDLVKTFGAYTAVSGINLDIRDGEFLIMVGPSGCGKTTTLNMISGLETPTSGEIVIGNTRGQRPRARRARARHGVPGSRPVPAHDGVREHRLRPARARRCRTTEIRQRVTAAAEAVHIKPLLAKLPRHCSGGESQRVALARTIVTNPAVFLMDEPLSSLDAKLRVDMRTELKRLHERLKATFVYVTHDQAEAMTMADRIVVMSKGRIEQVGTPLEIYNRPATRFVAGFFGTPTMNFLEGTVEANGGGRRFRGAGRRAAAARRGAGRASPAGRSCSACAPSMS